MEERELAEDEEVQEGLQEKEPTVAKMFQKLPTKRKGMTLERLKDAASGKKRRMEEEA
ncbi:hypothetical protein SLEP1_g52668 [Rubroshorea leprosula]|uniref:Uncharacterized protein n=1 Tax=Rubroshorea leprosula TaxID=152421 RepID=A0AAV5M6Z9_9ROSI|nr:hypothetical protein SLEP1_g52668 [Rubroshorea leprosula]